MPATRNHLVGPFLVMGIIGLAALGAGLTWFRYVDEHPSALWARLLGPKFAQAQFSVEATDKIQLGSKAIVSLEGVRSTGYVVAVEGAGAERLFRFVLLEPFAGARDGTPCQVTVDLTLPPEPLPLQ